MARPSRPQPLRLALVGFGHVGRRFSELLGGRYGRILRAAGVEPSITAIATSRHGSAIDAAGIATRRALAMARTSRLAELNRGAAVGSALDLIERAPADVLLEITALDPRTGQPALDHVRAALRRGLHVVSANKGPVAFAGVALQRLAAKHGRLFRHESAVMDGAPIFGLTRHCLPGARVLGFRGTLNCTTGHVLQRMEQGISMEAAVREMQQAGIAEADPSHDLDGWDSAVKGCVLASALMAAHVLPTTVMRAGIGALTPRDVQRALRARQRIRLVTRATRERGRVRVSVAPEALPIDDPLVSAGAASVLLLQTDLMGEIGVIEGAGTVDQTAYGLLADILEIVRSPRWL